MYPARIPTPYQSLPQLQSLQNTPYTTSSLSPCTPHIIFNLRQIAPEPTDLSKLQSNISRPEMHLDHSFYPQNDRRELSFRRSRGTVISLVNDLS
ncbi:hypothetical protein [Absidia glauca]|uniref:Uncharacterized protein n=1 Tax=Absidia glauca TaxID=4829 RepID=A0A168Q3V2_ABSGL|nr:hypothetical protein [Absidia glauca]